MAVLRPLPGENTTLSEFEQSYSVTAITVAVIRYHEQRLHMTAAIYKNTIFYIERRVYKTLSF